MTHTFHGLKALICVGSALALTAPAFGAGTGYIFVSNEGSNTVSVIDGENFAVIKTIETGEHPRDMRWNADKTKLLVAASGDVSVIDTDKKVAVTSISVGRTPHTVRIDD